VGESNHHVILGEAEYLKSTMAFSSPFEFGFVEKARWRGEPGRDTHSWPRRRCTRDGSA